VHKLLKKLETMLVDAAAQKTWGDIQIDLKDGRPILIRQTIQTKIHEECPNGSYSSANNR
jgi:hypothetical protein